MRLPKIPKLAFLFLPALLADALPAQSVTSPVGIVKVTVSGAPVGGTKLSVISATLRAPVVLEGDADSIGAYVDGAGDTSSQTLNTGATGWADGQWNDVPHLCYIETTSGAEEAFLITASSSAGVLTLVTSFDLTGRFPASPAYRICRANTLGSLFGETTVPFLTHASASVADNVYAWDGTAWITFHHNGSSWQSPATVFGGDANDAVVFPDEGLFVLRRGAEDLQITFAGTVPDKPLISTVPGDGHTFVSNRYPVGSTLNDLGFQQLPDWETDTSASNADVVYLWNGTSNSWVSYWHDGVNWQSPATVFGGDANNDPIPASSALFVLRRSSAPAGNAANTHTLPYTP